MSNDIEEVSNLNDLKLRHVAVNCALRPLSLHPKNEERKVGEDG